MSHSKKIAGNLAYLFAGELIASALAFFTTVRLARVLDTEGFGHWSFVLAIVVYLTFIVDMGLSTYGAREIARDVKTAMHYVTNILALRTVSAVVLFVLFSGFVMLTRQTMESKLLYIGAALWLFPQAWNVEFAFQGLERMYGVSLWRIGQQLFYFLFIFILIHHRAQLWHVPFYRAIGGIITVILLWIVLKKGRLPLTGKPITPQYWGGYLKVSAVMAASVVVNKIYYTFDTLLLGILDKAETVAWYNAGYKVILLFIGIAGLVQFAFGPTFSRSRDDAGQMKHSLRIFSLLLCFLGTLISGALILSSKDLILIIYGDLYANATSALNLLAISMLCVFINTIFLAPLLYTGFHKQYLYAIMAGAVVNIILNIIVIPLYSYNGAAMVTVVSNVCIAVCGFFLFKKHLFWPGQILLDILHILSVTIFLGVFLYMMAGSHVYTSILFIVMSLAFFMIKYYQYLAIAWKSLSIWIFKKT
jgi:O-antigen/teichoic acid export membrane protein